MGHISRIKSVIDTAPEMTQMMDSAKDVKTVAIKMLKNFKESKGIMKREIEDRTKGNC